MGDVVVLDGVGAQQKFSTTTDASGNMVGSTCVTDPSTGNKQAVAQLQNADNETISSDYAALTSSVALLLDPLQSTFDRQREIGPDNATPIGVAAVGNMVMGEVSVLSGSGTVTQTSTPTTITPAAMSGNLANSLGGQNWTIQVGTVILYDVGGANQELIEVISVTGTTFTAQFSQTHSANVPMLVRVYSQMRHARGAPGVVAVNTEGYKATYRYCLLAYSMVATPTDVILIQGSSTKTVRIKRVRITGQATAQGSMTVQLIRRSSAPSNLGSAVLTAITGVKHSSVDASATATISSVGTANITTLGTLVGPMGVGRLGMSPLGTGAAGEAQAVLWDFSTRNDKPIELRGTSEYLCINFNSAAIPSGGVVDFEIEVEEDNS